MSLVLSLFPGIGLLDRGFEAEGFTIVRGPDLLWGGDIRRFHPPAGKFEGIIGGPPCQAFSRMRHLVKHNGFTVAENLIPEFERCVTEAKPVWFLMENVPDSPTAEVPGYEVEAHLVSNRDHCGGEQRRRRKFSWGSVDGRKLILDWWHPPVPMAYTPAVTANGTVWDPSRQGAVGDRSRNYLRRAIRAQGLPDDFDLPGMTVAAKVRAVGNGVPFTMASTIARAVKATLEADAKKGAA